MSLPTVLLAGAGWCGLALLLATLETSTTNSNTLSSWRSVTDSRRVAATSGKRLRTMIDSRRTGRGRLGSTHNDGISFGTLGHAHHAVAT